MRQTISGLVAAIAVVAASAAPALACGGLFEGGCSPCGYAGPCAQIYVHAYSYTERLPDPVQQYGAAPMSPPQYYYVDQGPTFSGPGNFAPYRVYREGGVYGWSGHYRHHHHYARHYGYREPVLRRYY